MSRPAYEMADTPPTSTNHQKSFLLRSGLDLVFCAHHAREFERELRRSGALIGMDARQDAHVW